MQYRYKMKAKRKNSAEARLPSRGFRNTIQNDRNESHGAWEESSGQKNVYQSKPGEYLFIQISCAIKKRRD